MLRRPAVIVGLLLAGVLLLWWWWESRVPPGVEPQSDMATVQEWVKLVGGVVGVVGGLIGIVDKLKGWRAAKQV